MCLLVQLLGEIFHFQFLITVFISAAKGLKLKVQTIDDGVKKRGKINNKNDSLKRNFGNKTEREIENVHIHTYTSFLLIFGHLN